MASSTAPPPARARAGARDRAPAPEGAEPAEPIEPIQVARDLTDPTLHDVVEHLGGALADAGLARLPARAFAALMATEDGRLTAAELSTVLEVSPAGVSGAVRYLTQVRMIRRERERGSRRDVYVVADDAWHDVLMQSSQIYAPILAAMVTARSAVGERTRAGERMQLSVEFLEFVIREMGGIADRWAEYKAARGTQGG